MAPRLNKRALFADLGYTPHSQSQAALHESLAPRRIVACGVRWGKTISAAMEATAAALEPRERSRGWVVAPTYDLAEKAFREIVTLFHEKLPHRVVDHKPHLHYIHVRNMAGGLSEIHKRTGENPVSLLGEALDWLIIDEAARLRPFIWQSHLSQRLVDRHGWALMISTPKRKNWFYGEWLRAPNDPDYERFSAPSWENPHLDRQLIEAERGRLPERVFRQEYGGEFIEGEGQVFRRIHEAASGEWQEPKPGEAYYAGLDLAKVEDYTVMTVMNRAREVVAWDRFHRIEWGLQVARVKELASRYNRARILVDSTGVGDPIFESLKRHGCFVQGYQFTASSKAALIDNLALMLEQGALVLPLEDLAPEIVEELSSFEFSVSDAGHVRSGAPAGQHDDCVVSLALAAWQVRPSKPTPGVVLL